MKGKWRGSALKGLYKMGFKGHERMILAPFVLYFVAYWVDIHIFHPRGQTRPLAFWAPALIVAAMPTANNMRLADPKGPRKVRKTSVFHRLFTSFPLFKWLLKGAFP